MNEKAIMRETARSLKRMQPKKPRDTSAPKKPRKRRVSAKMRTLCMWHPPEQICSACNGGKIAVDVQGFPKAEACDGRQPVRMCGVCYRSLTRAAWEASGALGCPGCGKHPS